MCSWPTGSFFTDIYELKFCVQILHWDLQSSGMLHSVYCWLATDVSDNLPVPSSKVKQDTGGKNYNSMLREVPKDRRSHFIVDCTFPAKPVLFLMEDQHCSK